MAIPVEMPKMSDTMEEGVLVAWLVQEGDTVSPGDIIAQVETDKATMDLEAYDSGVLLKQVASEGEGIPIGALIAVLGKADEDISAVLAKYDGKGASSPAATPMPSGDGADVSHQPVAEPVATPAQDADSRLRVSPVARKLAQDHNLDLQRVQGSGPEGRIVKRDVEAALAMPQAPKAAPAPTYAPAPAAAGEDTYEVVRLSQMRKTIARRLAQSKFTAPHFYVTVDVDMERAWAVRQEINAFAEAQGRPRISFNDLVNKSCAMALRQHPQVNASYMEAEGEIRFHASVHVGVAVAIDEGLVTPVIRHADQKSLGQIAEEVRTLAQRARDRKLQPEEMAGSTFTTSNLGMFGVEEFTAIINPPNACILAIGAIRDVPVVKDGAVVPGKRMKITLSSDHRVVDGAVGAQFLATVRQYLEEPTRLLL